MIVKLLTEHYLEFLSLKGGCTGSSESTHVKIPHCWKSHVAAQLRLRRNRSIDPNLGLLHNKIAYILATRELIHLLCTTIARVLGFMKKQKNSLRSLDTVLHTQTVPVS